MNTTVFLYSENGRSTHEIRTLPPRRPTPKDTLRPRHTGNRVRRRHRRVVRVRPRPRCVGRPQRTPTKAYQPDRAVAYVCIEIVVRAVQRIPSRGIRLRVKDLLTHGQDQTNANGPFDRVRRTFAGLPAP